MELGRRFVTLIYPFQYASELRLRGRARPARRMRLFSERWVPWWHRLDDQETREAVTDGNFFLPYVRDLLYPEIAMLPAGSLEMQVHEIQRRMSTGFSADELVSHLSPETVVRLTMHRGHLEPFRDMILNDPAFGDDQSWAMELRWVDLLLFTQQVGFLVLRFVPRSPVESLTSWAASLDAMATVHPPFLDWTLPTWTIPASQGGPGLTNRVLVEYLLQGWTEEQAPRNLREIDAFSEADEQPHYTRSALGQIYGARFHMQVFACARETEEGPADRLFVSSAEKALFHMGTGLSPDSDAGRPHRRRIEDLRERNLLAIWDNWQGLVLPDRVLFLATRCTPFTDRSLPRNVGSEYLVLHLLTLFQKIRLSLLNGELLRREKSPRQHRRRSEVLWDDFIAFQNHYWYSEVTPLDQGKLLYSKFQKGLDALPLYEQMKDEVRQLQQYYEHRAERRVQGLLNFLTFIAFPLGLWATLVGPTLFAPAAKQVATTWSLALLWLGGLSVPALLLWNWWLRRP